MNVNIKEELLGIVRAGVIELRCLTYPERCHDRLWQGIRSACATIEKNYAGQTVGKVPGVIDTRRLFRAVGLEPTKRRPSSEALLRRVIRGQSLNRIHPLVDMCNLVSLVSLIPVGLYDLSNIAGDTVTIQLGDPSWRYDGFRELQVNLAGRLCAADAIGPFGSPTSDSLRTGIRGLVPNALVILYQYRGGTEATLRQALAQTQSLAESHFGATIVGPTVVGG
ncbi:MAG: phenylalanine--tRNA ligase beta subunit-related protein [Myxococcota bacterium]|nr:phenylalanine--tRNA ligase beta subunit-related protein [Myxococcota bacterium]